MLKTFNETFTNNMPITFFLQPPGSSGWIVGRVSLLIHPLLR